MIHNGKFGEVTVALATFPSRVDRAVDVLRTMWPQCHHLKACFNEFNKEPEILVKFLSEISGDINATHTFEYVLAYGGNGIADLGCNNKMRWIDKCNGYYLTVDDDIIYPKNYVETMVNRIDAHNGNCVVTVHGNIFLPDKIGGPVVPDNSHKIIYFYGNKLEEDTQIHLGGMGTGGFVPRIVKLTWSLFSDKKNSGDDEKVAIFCNKHNIPIYSIKRPDKFLKANEVKTYRLCTDKKSRADRIEMLKQVTWPVLPKPGLYICYITDGNNHTEKELATSLYSLLTNISIPVEIHILALKISKNLERCIDFLKKKFDVDIIIKSISNIHLKKCQTYNAPTIAMGKATATSIALTKFDLPRFLPSDADHVLYLDTDTVILGSLAKLAEMTLDNNMMPVLAAIGEKGTIKVDYKKQPYHAYNDYFNTGVLLMNLTKFRKEGYSQKLWDAKQNCLDQHLTDQNAFNAVFHNIVHLLPVQYNAVCYKEQPADSLIMHFCGHNKPLVSPNCRYADTWMKYWNDVKHFFIEDNIESLFVDDEQTVVEEIPQICSIGFDFNDTLTKHDFVWVLGSGSKYKDQELLFSIQSAITFCGDWINRIYIVGSKPRCDLSNYEWIHIPCSDPFNNKDANIISKTLYAINRIPDLTDVFMLCSDDQVAIKPCTYKDFEPHYVRNFDKNDKAFYSLCHREVVANRWLLNLYNTMLRFSNNQAPVYYYQPHIWSPINKASFKEMCENIDWSKNPANIIFTLYYNYIQYQDPIPSLNNAFYTRNLVGWGNELHKTDKKFIGYNDTVFASSSFRTELALYLKKAGAINQA